ncbi:hypothetical protein CONLIGDRAFT_638951 [Coniochaeta ligniaria NRRL 30616]|uniref:Secreted protein n=1 Tax=Coniochaeta ligniaria NRRL 30616 TaxID=1408157 RepID=A0A1J7K365_9PEZI|nr:hypothetical protein CONLIGDRAFT_638951 [Coniochaeta ligniaria NRRL 30616]
MGALSRITVAIAALYAPLAAADTPASQPRITSVQYSGNGCPNDASRSGSFSDPTFTYNRFAAVLPGTNQTVNCEIHVQAAGGSAGWQVALSDVNIDGHLVLDQGTRLDYYTTVYYSENAGSTTTARQHISNNGGSTLDYPVSLRQDITKPVWSECIGGDGSPGILNVNFRGALTGGGHAYFEVFTENWDFIWRRC